MKKHKCLLVLLILICSIFHTQASAKLNFRNIDVKSGISDNYIRSILRDKYGFMWFGTGNGLDRYDGYQFRQYSITQLGSYNNDISSVMEDRNGTIWIKGPVSYYYYDREQDIIDNKIHHILNSYGIEGEVNYLTIDKDKNLWCVTSNKLYYYNFAQEKLSVFELNQNKSIRDLSCRKTNAYILFSDGEIAYANLKTNAIISLTNVEFKTDLNQHIYLDTLDRLWFYTSHFYGLDCYDTVNKIWTSYPGEKIIRKDLITSVMAIKTRFRFGCVSQDT